MREGPVDWKSFPYEKGGGHTDIRVKLPETHKSSYQHIINLDWDDYGTQQDVEALAEYITHALRATYELKADKEG